MKDLQNNLSDQETTLQKTDIKQVVLPDKNIDRMQKTVKKQDLLLTLFPDIN